MLSSYFINFLKDNDLNQELLIFNQNTYSLLSKYLTSLLNEIDQIFILIAYNQDDSKFINFFKNLNVNVLKIENNTYSLLKAFLNSKNETILYSNSIYPLLNTPLTLDMLTKHRKYKNDYSFSEGYPLGFTPEILNYNIIDYLIKIAKNEPLNKDAIFNALKEDINAFDIDAVLSQDDHRIHRIELYSENKLNHIILKNILALKQDNDLNMLDPDKFSKLIIDNQQILRSIPNYFTIEISDKNPHKKIHSPYFLSKNHFMNLPDFKNILNKIVSFSDSAVVSLGSFCEITYNKDLYEMLDYALKCDIDKLLVQTSGINWDLEKLSEIFKQDNKVELIFIVEADTDNLEIYKKMRIKLDKDLQDDFNEMQKFIGFLKENKSNFYIQAIRTVLNEENMHAFFKNYKDQGINVIVNNFNNFGGYLKDLTVVNLDPIKKFSCWHLKRDFNILVDGTVLSCLNDYVAYNKNILDPKFLFGNIIKDDIKDIWEKGIDLYLLHLENINKINKCMNCHEYYNFNF